MGSEDRDRGVARTQRVQAGGRGYLEVQLQAVRLKVVAGPDQPREATLFLPSVGIGTSPENELVLTDPTVSGRHAILEDAPAGLRLRDLGSTNGTFLGSRRVETVFLSPGDEFRVGETTLRVEPATRTSRTLLDESDRLGELIGASPAMQDLYGLLRAVAPTPVTVLLSGESGTGKELAARTLHQLSGRNGELVVFDATSSDPQFLRSDLFGHVKGAFTGAAGAREGAFRQAHRGTLFLDEVGEIPLDLQPRLLRVLESREVTPVGADRPVPVDVRLVAATHRDLEAMVREGSFRRDLYHRLAAFRVALPPLRDRREDVPLLVATLAERFGTPGRFSPEALAVLVARQWEGNVRELRNAVERALVLSGGGEVRPEHLDEGPGRPPARSRAGDPEAHADSTGSEVGDDCDEGLRGAVASEERRLIEATLARCGGNQRKTAEALGISLATLKRRLRRIRAG